MKPLLNLYNVGLILTFIFILSAVANSHIQELKSSPSMIPDLSLVNPLPRAYAHNDYENPKPLMDAIELGFTFIEADVHLINDSLFVSHDFPNSRKDTKTLTTLYLEPLFNLQKLHNGKIYPGSNKPVTLMVDIKTEAEATYQKLKEKLVPFHEMLCSWNNMKAQKNAVKIIVSGNRPIQTILKEDSRLVQIDGRIEDLPCNYSNELMPMISDNYTKVFGYSFFKRSYLKSKQLQKIASITNKVHDQGKTIRLWNSPEKEKVWEQLIEQGVDIINTDKLQKLSNYLKRNQGHAPHVTFK